MVKTILARFMNKSGASELMVYGLLALFSLVVSAAAYSAVDTPLDTGVTTITTTVTDSFTTVSGL